MVACEEDIVYQLNGRMTHRTPDAQRTINLLNLRHGALTEKRRKIIDLILFEYVEDIDNMELEDPEFLELIVEELKLPDAHGKLEAFAPVIVNVLRQYLA